MLLGGNPIRMVKRKLLRQMMGQFSELFVLENFAAFRDRQWNYLCPHSNLVQEPKMLGFSFKNLHNFRWPCLSLRSLTWLHHHSLSILSIWIQFCWEFFWFFGRFQLLLGFSDWLHNIVCVEVSLNRSDETFGVDYIIFRHLMQSVICTSSQTFRPKNVLFVLVNFHLLIQTAIWKKFVSMSPDEIILCSHKRKITPIRLRSRSGPDRSMSSKTRPRYFAAALRSSDLFGFMRVMSGWGGKL